MSDPAAQIPTLTVPIPTDPADIVEGRRLALFHGCFNDCHGSQGEGRVMFDQPAIARIVAPNLTSAVRSYSDAQLVGIIREGVRPGGRSVLAMPSETFVTLTDADLGRIIAYMKSLPVTEGAGRSVSLGPIRRIGVVAGKLRTGRALGGRELPVMSPRARQNLS